MNESATIWSHSVGGVPAGHLEGVPGTSRHISAGARNANNDVLSL